MTTALERHWRRRRWLARLWPHRWASFPQPKWYDWLHYAWAQYADLDRLEVTTFPTFNRGGQYCCGHCDRTFPDHYTRNVHQWREHPGCPRFRIAKFWDFVRLKRSWSHSCRCRPVDCEQGCYYPGGPYR